MLEMAGVVGATLRGVGSRLGENTATRKWARNVPSVTTTAAARVAIAATAVVAAAAAAAAAIATTAAAAGAVSAAAVRHLDAVGRVLQLDSRRFFGVEDGEDEASEVSRSIPYTQSHDENATVSFVARWNPSGLKERRGFDGEVMKEKEGG